MPTIIKQKQLEDLEISYSVNKSIIIIKQISLSDEESIWIDLSTIPNLIKVLEKYKEVE